MKEENGLGHGVRGEDGQENGGWGRRLEEENGEDT